MPDLFPCRLDGVPLQVMIDAVEREIRQRQRAYPRWVAEKRMTQDFADDQIFIMQAVVEFLKQQRGIRP